ncbi:MAG: glycosyltransferase [Fimbriimonadaceae bacterium]|nr:hypothetical protein [Fimbriimonadaceae bacterium]MCC6351494.1 glycosyltransferase family 2 protein [Fimbriimonadaceae bacterium]MCL4283925.1 glycosyltransferase [Fimbriimonadaceae bacterium]QOJ12746.1 MAG: glycosyltransferase family 2 protein [Chthonomonadaceae bacterium]
MSTLPSFASSVDWSRPDSLASSLRFLRPLFVDSRVAIVGEQAAEAAHFASLYAESITAWVESEELRIEFLIDSPSIPCRLVADLDAGSWDWALLQLKAAEASNLNFEAFGPRVVLLVRDSAPSADSDSGVRWFSRSTGAPNGFSEGIEPHADEWIGFWGEIEVPVWPKVCGVIPTLSQVEMAVAAAEAFLNTYPGHMELVVVANGTAEPLLDTLQGFSNERASAVRLVVLPENRGFAGGVNAGLAALGDLEEWDIVVVSNDDVIPHSECMAEIASSWRELKERGLRPGIVGPVSNNINGRQQVEIGIYASADEMQARATAYHRDNCQSVSQEMQIRGLLLWLDQELVSEIGGFDPRFGIGNFEDDDYNLRARIAGYTLWRADGAFLHHAGSSTFRSLNVDYEANIARNASLFCEKWQIESLDRWPLLERAPQGVSLYCDPDTAYQPSEFSVTLNGERIDLVTQASDIEFAGWVLSRLAQFPRSKRRDVIALLTEASTFDAA